MGSWVKCHRSLAENELWLLEPFTKGQAFWDLVMNANHADGRFICGNEVVKIKRGQYFTSELKLSKRWGWSRNKVRAYLKLLESLKMGTAKGTAKGTLITIENYGIYQGKQTDDSTTQGTTKGHGKVQQKDSKKTSKGTQTRRSKEEPKKNKEELKNLYGEYRNVKLSTAEYEKLLNEFPSDYRERIERLSEYMASTGKKYKNHLATIRAWARKEKQNANSRTDRRAESKAAGADGNDYDYEKFFK